MSLLFRTLLLQAAPDAKLQNIIEGHINGAAVDFKKLINK